VFSLYILLLCVRIILYKRFDIISKVILLKDNVYCAGAHITPLRCIGSDAELVSGVSYGTASYFRKLLHSFTDYILRCEHGFICTLKSRLGVRYMIIWLSVSVLEVLKFPPLGFCNCNKFICTVCKANNR